MELCKAAVPGDSHVVPSLGQDVIIPNKETGHDQKGTAEESPSMDQGIDTFHRRIDRWID